MERETADQLEALHPDAAGGGVLPGFDKALDQFIQESGADEPESTERNGCWIFESD